MYNLCFIVDVYYNLLYFVIVEGCCMVAALVDLDTGFLDCYLTKKDRRGRGFGSRVFKAAIAASKQNNVILDALPTAVHIYERALFKKSRIIIRKLKYSSRPGESFNFPPKIKYEGAEYSTVNIIDITMDTVNRIAVYDKAVTGLNRGKFIRAQLANQCVIKAALTNDIIVGYGVLNKVNKG